MGVSKLTINQLYIEQLKPEEIRDYIGSDALFVGSHEPYDPLDPDYKAQYPTEETKKYFYRDETIEEIINHAHIQSRFEALSTIGGVHVRGLESRYFLLEAGKNDLQFMIVGDPTLFILSDTHKEGYRKSLVFIRPTRYKQSNSSLGGS